MVLQLIYCNKCAAANAIQPMRCSLCVAFDVLQLMHRCSSSCHTANAIQPMRCSESDASCTSHDSRDAANTGLHLVILTISLIVILDEADAPYTDRVAAGMVCRIFSRILEAELFLLWTYILEWYYNCTRGSSMLCPHNIVCYVVSYIQCNPT